MVIIDYGVGNLASVRNMFKRIGIDAVVSSDLGVIGSAEQLVLPGVGAFDVGMNNLASRGMIELLTRRVIHEMIPIMGICLGMQLLTKRSDEGLLPGLGWIDAETRKLSGGVSPEELRIPHMGWNQVEVCRSSCPLVYGIDPTSRYYFVHSYCVHCNDPELVLGKTSYGDLFTSMVWQGNIYGAQFHPEKSHKFGMAILKNFAERCRLDHDKN